MQNDPKAILRTVLALIVPGTAEPDEEKSKRVNANQHAPKVDIPHGVVTHWVTIFINLKMFKASFNKKSRQD